MPVWQALIYGIVQGLAEFLPVSSSAHLTLLPWALHWTDPGLAFDVALHWGTLLAVLAVFWKDWIRLISAGLLRRGSDVDKRLFWGLVVASIPAAIAGKLLDRWVEANLRAPLLIAAALAVLGVLLWIADRQGSKTRALDQMTVPRALSLGVAQVFALVPGVSRSGATITAALFQGFNREESARFSFLMSTPVIFGAGLLKLPEMVREMRGGEGEVTWAGLAAGFVASAVVGAIVIQWMLDYLRRRSYAVFAGYRVLVAAATVLLWLSR